MRLQRLDFEFVGSPADEICGRIDYKPKGFDVTIFRGSDSPEVKYYMEPHKSAHARGLNALSEAKRKRNMH